MLYNERDIYLSNKYIYWKHKIQNVWGESKDSFLFHMDYILRHHQRNNKSVFWSTLCYASSP